MKTTWLLIKHQFREWHLNKLLYVFILSIFCLWLYCLFTGISEYKSVNNLRENAHKESRKQWLNQDEKHPHIAAHFGNFAFKPINILSVFDKGIEAYSGTYVYLEAHKQNDFIFSPAQNSSSFIRFGELNASLILQIIIPLFLIILTFNSLLAEKESGSLVLMKVAGITNKQLVNAKVLSPLLLTGSLIILLYTLSFLVFFLLGMPFSSQDVLKLLMIVAGYFAYYFIFLSFNVWVASISKTLKQSLTILLSVWVFTCVLMPKFLGNLSSDLYTLPSNISFKEAVKNDILNGIDGHNTSDLRAKKFTDSLLQKYNVDSTSQLPVNIEGLIMMEGEKYSSKVYNNHFDSLSNILLKQQRIFTYAGFINPLFSIKNLAIGLSNTDFLNEMTFRKEAEAYRMEFVQAMNQDMAQNSKEGEFDTYKVGKKLYQNLGEFSYPPPNIKKILEHYFLDILALLFMILVGLAINNLTTRNI